MALSFTVGGARDTFEPRFAAEVAELLDNAFGGEGEWKIQRGTMGSRPIGDGPSSEACRGQAWPDSRSQPARSQSGAGGSLLPAQVQTVSLPLSAGSPLNCASLHGLRHELAEPPVAGSCHWTTRAWSSFLTWPTIRSMAGSPRHRKSSRSPVWPWPPTRRPAAIAPSGFWETAVDLKPPPPPCPLPRLADFSPLPPRRLIPPRSRPPSRIPPSLHSHFRTPEHPTPPHPPSPPHPHTPSPSPSSPTPAPLPHPPSPPTPPHLSSLPDPPPPSDPLHFPPLPPATTVSWPVTPPPSHLPPFPLPPPPPFHPPARALLPPPRLVPSPPPASLSPPPSSPTPPHRATLFSLFPLAPPASYFPHPPPPLHRCR